MISKWTIAFTCTLIAFSESAFVDKLQKCEIYDIVCYKELLKNILQDMGQLGIVEYNIKPIDPFRIEEFKIPILDLVTITVVDGEARGMKDCTFDNIVSDYKKGHLVLEMTCNLDIKARVKLGEISPLLQNSLGIEALEGGGNAKVKLDKLQLKLEYFYDIIKKDDGEIYIKCKQEQSVHDYKIGNAEIVVDKMVLGKQDVTKLINNFLGQNKEFLLKKFAKDFFTVAMRVLFNLVEIFFDKTPVKHFISTDLSSYVKNV